MSKELIDEFHRVRRENSNEGANDGIVGHIFYSTLFFSAVLTTSGKKFNYNAEQWNLYPSANSEELAEYLNELANDILESVRKLSEDELEELATYYGQDHLLCD